MQYTPNYATKTYADFETVQESMTFICDRFEKKLKKENPNSPQITYGLTDLLKYIDDLHDIVCLTYFF